jgi:hypothetical protein
VETARDQISVPQDGYDVVRWAFSVDGAPLPWTDAVMQVRAKADQSSTLIGELSVADGSITITLETVDAVTSTVIAVTLSEVFLSPIDPDVYAFDLRAFDADSHPHYPIAGPFTVRPSVTAPEVTP